MAVDHDAIAQPEGPGEAIAQFAEPKRNRNAVIGSGPR